MLIPYDTLYKLEPNLQIISSFRVSILHVNINSYGLKEQKLNVIKKQEDKFTSLRGIVFIVVTKRHLEVMQIISSEPNSDLQLTQTISKPSSTTYIPWVDMLNTTTVVSTVNAKMQ